MNGFLSNLNIYDYTKEQTEPAVQFKEEDVRFKKALFSEYGVAPVRGGQSYDNKFLPIINGDFIKTISQTALSVISEIDRKRLLQSYLIYAHEFLEPPSVLTPSMKVKQYLKIKAMLPFSLRGAGSAGAVQAIELLAVSPGCEKDHLVICADKAREPTAKKLPARYPVGDSICAFLYSKEKGDFKILSSKVISWHIGIDNIHEFDDNTAEKLYREMADKVGAFLYKHFSKHQKRVTVILQSFSPFVTQYIKTIASELVQFYERQVFPQINFLSSDPFISLYELEKSSLIKRGDITVLVFIGSLGNIGFLTLQYDGA